MLWAVVCSVRGVTTQKENSVSSVNNIQRFKFKEYNYIVFGLNIFLKGNSTSHLDFYKKKNRPEPWRISSSETIV